MDVIARVEWLFQPDGSSRITNDRIEVHHRIEMSLRSNPTIHSLPDLFAAFRGGGNALFRHDRRADHFDAVCVAALDDLPISPDEFITGERRRSFGAAAKIDVI